MLKYFLEMEDDCLQECELEQKINAYHNKEDEK